MSEYRIEVVIPIGPGDPSLDVPNMELLEYGLRCIEQQNIPVKLTCAVDEDLPPHKLDLIKQYANKVVLFPPYSYHRPGGIWDKIYTCWEQSDCEFVAWQGYDDVSSLDRFEQQLKVLDETGANACVCKTAWLTDGVVSRIPLQIFSDIIGRHYLFMGAFVIRRDAILNSGIAQYRRKWSYYFEGLLYTFVAKIAQPPVWSDGTFYYRNHIGTISNTYQNEWFEQIQRKINYPPEQCKADWDSIGFEQLCVEVRKLYE